MRTLDIKDGRSAFSSSLHENFARGMSLLSAITFIPFALGLTSYYAMKLVGAGSFALQLLSQAAPVMLGLCAATIVSSSIALVTFLRLPKDKNREGHYVFKGDKRDIAAVKKLDRKLCKLSKRFNGHSSIPEEKLAAVATLLEKNRETCKRVEIENVQVSGLFRTTKNVSRVASMNYSHSVTLGSGAKTNRSFARVSLK